MAKVSNPESRRSTPASGLTWRPWLIFGCLLVLLCGAYWSLMKQLVDGWGDPSEVMDWVVLVLAGAVLWRWREPILLVARGERWFGVVLILAGLTGRILFSDLNASLGEAAMFGLCVVGVTTVVGGWAMFYWTMPALVLLVFALPRHCTSADRLFQSPQLLASGFATYLLQLIGLDARNTGNVIFVDQLREGIIDSCNCLRLVMPIVATGVAILFWKTRRALEQVLIFFSALFLAWLVNVLRIMATVMATANGNSNLAELLSGTLGAWLMYLAAAGALALETWLLARRPHGHGIETAESFSSMAQKAHGSRSLWSCSATAAVVIAAFGAVQWVWTARSFEAAKDPLEAMAKIIQKGEIPPTLGSWVGYESDEFDREDLPDGILAAKSYRYRLGDQNQEIALFVICGFGSAVARHQPNDCFPKSSLLREGSQRGQRNFQQASIVLTTGDFVREDPTGQQKMVISWLTAVDRKWSWGESGWGFDRFGGAAPTLRAYFFYSDRGHQASSGEGPTIDFANAFLDGVIDVVFPAEKPAEKPGEPKPEESQKPAAGTPASKTPGTQGPATQGPGPKTPGEQTPASQAPGKKKVPSRSDLPSLDMLPEPGGSVLPKPATKPDF